MLVGLYRLYLPHDFRRVLVYPMLWMTKLSGFFTNNMITNIIKDIQEQAGNNHKVTGLSAALADPDFLIQC